MQKMRQLLLHLNSDLAAVQVTVILYTADVNRIAELCIPWTCSDVHILEDERKH